MTICDHGPPVYIPIWAAWARLVEQSVGVFNTHDFNKRLTCLTVFSNWILLPTCHLWWWKTCSKTENKYLEDRQEQVVIFFKKIVNWRRQPVATTTSTAAWALKTVSVMRRCRLWHKEKLVVTCSRTLQIDMTKRISTKLDYWFSLPCTLSVLFAIGFYMKNASALVSGLIVVVRFS